jgi:hypothetical protein
MMNSQVKLPYSGLLAILLLVQILIMLISWSALSKSCGLVYWLPLVVSCGGSLYAAFNLSEPRLLIKQSTHYHLTYISEPRPDPLEYWPPPERRW